MRPRVVIVGAGIIGSACARSLARRGADVVVLDRGAAAGETSASGEGNLLVSDKAPGPELELALYSLRLWPSLRDDLVAELGAEFAPIEFQAKGGVVAALTPGESEELAKLAEAQRQAGVDARRVSVEEALELEPELSRSISSAVYYPDDAQVQPAIATEALLASARLSGARFVPGVAVTGPLRDAAGTLTGVSTTSGNFEADCVVVAAGPWSGEVAASLGGTLLVGPRKGILLVTARMPQRVLHKVYDTSYVSNVQAANRDLQTSTVVESTASGTVLIGSSRQNVGFDRRIDAKVVQTIAERAVRLMPFLRDVSIIRAYCGFRPYSSDHLPVIGPDREVPGLWYASGHEGAGIGLAPATAELLATLLLGGTPAVATDPFLPRATSDTGGE